MSGLEYIISIFTIISNFLTKLVGMMNDSIWNGYFNTSLAYILVAAWIVWTVLNIFIIRPFAIGGVASILQENYSYSQRRANAAAENERKASVRAADRSKPRTYTYSRTYRNGTKERVQYTRYADGSVERKDLK